MNTINPILSDFFSNPLTGITLSLAAYSLGLLLYRLRPRPYLHPLLTGALLLILFLEFSPCSHGDYQEGGRIIILLLGPATTALGLPLYRQRRLLKSHALPILVSIGAGSLAGVGSVWLLARLLGLPRDLLISLIPKSVTTPIAVEISQGLGGIPAVTAMAVVFTGIIGAAAAPLWLRLLAVRDPVARGLAMGTSAHAIGTSRAVEMGDEEGAMGGLAIGLAGLFTVGISILLPL